jgi:MFS family permease
MTPTLTDVESTKERKVKNKGMVILPVILSGVGLLSDGYNAQIISSASAVLAKLYPTQLTTDLKTRLSQSYFIGVIVGALFIGCLIDRIGRRAGVALATFVLLLGVVMSAISTGKTVQGMIWMLIVARGILGTGAGAEYPGEFYSNDTRKINADWENS